MLPRESALSLSFPDIAACLFLVLPHMLFTCPFSFLSPAIFIPKKAISLISCQRLKAFSCRYMLMFFHIALFIIGITGILTLIHVPGGDNKYAFLARTFIAFSWICLGHSFRRTVNRLPTFQWFALALTVFSVTCIFASTTSFEMVWNKYYGTILSPLTFGVSGSIALMAFSRNITGPLQSFLASLGRESFHIMVNHLFVFFLLDMFFIVFLNDSSWFKGIYSFPDSQKRFVFLIAGCLLPWFAAQRLRRFLQRRADF